MRRLPCPTLPWLLIVAGSLCLSGPAAAIDAQRLFEQLDGNDDGQVVRGEVSEEYRQLYQRLVRTGDANGDGRLDVDEFRIALTPARAEKQMPEKSGSRLPGADAAIVLLAKLDATGDGRITPGEISPELQQPYRRLCEMVDSDNNGILIGRELAQAGPQLSILAENLARRLQWDVAAELAKLPPEKRRAIESTDAFPPLGDLITDPARTPELFRLFDANEDGQLVATEIPAPVRERFQQLLRRMDLNGDGGVNQAEVRRFARRSRAADFNSGAAPPMRRMQLEPTPDP